ncbi:hypothetical protein D3C75_234260 [compost metagenome]
MVLIFVLVTVGVTAQEGAYDHLIITGVVSQSVVTVMIKVLPNLLEALAKQRIAG